MSGIVQAEHHLAEADAEAFASVLGKNWEGALLVARSAEKGEAGRPGIGRKPTNKISLRRFAEVASMSWLRLDDVPVLEREQYAAELADIAALDEEWQ